MTQADLLTMLEHDLEIVTTYMDEEAVSAIEEQLAVYLDAAAELIKTEGISLDIENSTADALLQVMYAGYLYEKRKTNEPMPRMLRWALNNRLFSEAVMETDA